jgi:hypothetical protein
MIAMDVNKLPLLSLRHFAESISTLVGQIIFWIRMQGTHFFFMLQEEPVMDRDKEI